ncbi:MAG TPA: AraC family transcriptional regulator [Opitutaceae bacterium]
MNATPWATGPVQAHWIRPGLCLFWGSELNSYTPPTDTAVLFCFVIGPDAQRAADGMLALRKTDNAYDLLAGAFHATIAVSSAACAEFAPGAPRLAEFVASADTPAIALPLTPAARLALESIRRCPFVGPLREMALTARGNDLLLEFLTTLSLAEPSRPGTLLRSATGQIETAAAYLAKHLEQPPSVAELARQVGLSETTLKRGFHQVYGTTVFGYLRTRRMERAKALLESGEATVLEASTLVGYSNPSNFAAAFRQQFGLNPKEFQLGSRRQS